MNANNNLILVIAINPIGNFKMQWLRDNYTSWLKVLYTIIYANSAEMLTMI